ncbi:MAG: repeat-containing protein [Gemmataceae bacterium]|nr:repeat-containing protein [Gemmataceae bacterium]
MPVTNSIRRLMRGRFRSPKPVPVRTRCAVGRRIEQLEDRLAPAATPLIPLQASDTILVATPNTGQGNTRIAMKPDGSEFVAVWQDVAGGGAGGGSDLGIFAQRFDANWKPAGGVIQVNTTTADTQDAPAVGMDASGNFVVAWQSFSKPGSFFVPSVFAQRFDSAGNKLGGEFHVPSAAVGTNNERNPAVGVNASGEFVIAWNNGGATTGNVFAREYNSITSGTVVSGASDVQISTYAGPGGSGADEIDPSVAVNTNGGFVVAWESFGQDTGAQTGFGIYFRQFGAGGTSPGSETQANVTTAGDQLAPSVAVDGSGNIVITWYSQNVDAANFGVVQRRFDSTGAATTTETLVNPPTNNNQQFPRISMNAAGAYVIAWDGQDPSGTGQNVYAQRYDSSGTAVGSEIVINSGPGGGQSLSNATPAIDSAGDFVVGYEGGTSPRTPTTARSPPPRPCSSRRPPRRATRTPGRCPSG